METILDTALCTALAGYIHSSLSPRQVLASLLASMDSSLLEPYYIELGQLIQVNRICQAAAITWLVYDSFIVFNQEIEYIWKRPPTMSTFLYLALRYLGSAWVIFFSTAFFLDKPSLAFCRVFVPMEVWPTWIIVSTVQVMLQMRLYVLYQRSKKVLALLVTLFLAEAAVTLVMCVKFSSTVNASNQPLPGVYFCTSSTSSEQFFPDSVYTILAFESILFCLCIWASYQRSKGDFSAPGLRWSRSHLIDILIEGNVFYFLCFALTWVAALVALSVYGFQWGQAVNAFGSATSIVAGCHLILHLREAVSHPTLHQTTFRLGTGVVFACRSTTTATSDA